MGCMYLILMVSALAPTIGEEDEEVIALINTNWEWYVINRGLYMDAFNWIIHDSMWMLSIGLFMNLCG